ncbi:hypothetical protein ABEW05_008024 [Botrytis cinerea]
MSTSGPPNGPPSAGINTQQNSQGPPQSGSLMSQQNLNQICCRQYHQYQQALVPNAVDITHTIELLPPKFIQPLAIRTTMLSQDTASAEAGGHSTVGQCAE